MPIVVLPFVNTAPAGRAPFCRSVQELRLEGVRILLDARGFEPHPPRTGGAHIDSFPWHIALDEAEQHFTALAEEHGKRSSDLLPWLSDVRARRWLTHNVLPDPLPRW